MIVATGIALTLILTSRSCKQARESAGNQQYPAPVIEITPLKQGDRHWKIAGAEMVAAIVKAPGAESARILGRPEGMEDNYLELRTLAAPVDLANGKFETQLNLSPDFAGQIWAEAVYPGGSRKSAKAILLAVDTAGNQSSRHLDVVGGSVGTDESARSDKLTGGRIIRAKLISGEPDVRITVNAPAFQLTLWQNGKEVSAYPIGIGHKDFSLPVGERGAAAVIFNPQWIPPGSAWVNGRDDTVSRLGKIRIPLGDGCMIRKAAKADDIGRAVSRGCISMLGPDLMDLAEKLAAARNLPVTKSRDAWLRDGGRERIAASLDPPVLVDINYDLHVVEGRVLRLYPDVYNRGAFELDSLRAELHGVGVATSRLGDPSLQRILDRAGADSQFVINVADVRKGRLWRGRKMPLIHRQADRIVIKKTYRAYSGINQ
jgi:hypothetical protein